MYNRQQAVAYAERYWNSHNPAFHFFPEDDCTNYISQCLHAGGFPMEFSKSRARGWWYRNGSWSYSWVIANSLYWYLKRKAQSVSQAQDLQLGDVISVDFEGDGRWNHSGIVTYKDENGEPYISTHTINGLYRHWEFRDSYAYSPNIRYGFFHII